MRKCQPGVATSACASARSKASPGRLSSACPGSNSAETQRSSGRPHAVFVPAAMRASLVADRLVALGLAPALLSVAGYVHASSE